MKVWKERWDKKRENSTYNIVHGRRKNRKVEEIFEKKKLMMEEGKSRIKRQTIVLKKDTEEWKDKN